MNNENTEMLQILVMGLCYILTLQTVYCRVEQLELLPEHLQHNFDIYQQMTRLDKQPGKLIFWGSLQHYVSQKFLQKNWTMLPAEEDFFQKHTAMFIEPIYAYENATRLKRQALRPRIRKEIRMLSINERRTYFRALNIMKRDRRLRPNVYDCLADFHQGENIGRAHFGPAFPGWHRLYLWLFESFLRLYEPTATIPYWASVLDNDMNSAVQSVIWSEGFYGRGQGGPSGPFRTWPTVSPDYVFTRDIGNGPLYSYEDINAILRKRFNRQILIPTADEDSNFEFLHGGPHTFVSGSMNSLNDAVKDPIFYSHHCFVDYIWELFRIRQRNTPGVRPGQDYPFNSSDPNFRAEHAPGGRAGFFPRRQMRIDYTLRTGLSESFFFLVQYEGLPRCPRCGNSPYLFCNQTLSRCVSRTRQELGGGNYVDDLFVNTTHSNTTESDPCPGKPFIKEKDPGTTMSDLAYIPIRIISKRPPTFNQFKKYSLYTYSSRSRTPLPSTKIPLIQSGTQTGFKKCDVRDDAVSKIKIITYGLNYKGETEEESVIDNRLGVSQSTGFAVVKAPTPGNPTEAMVAAFDSCGCVCRPFCIKGMNSSSVSKFTGGVRVTTELPLQYGLSYAEAILGTWNMPTDAESPEIVSANIPLTFYCDYGDDWIWQGPGSLSLEKYRAVTNGRSNNDLQVGRIPERETQPPATGRTTKSRALNQVRGLNRLESKHLASAMELGSNSLPTLVRIPQNGGISLTGNDSKFGASMPRENAIVKRFNMRGRENAQRRHRNLERMRQERQRLRARGRINSGRIEPIANLAKYAGRAELGCVLSTTCTLIEQCSPCVDRQLALCPRTGQYAVCLHGRFQIIEYLRRHG